MSKNKHPDFRVRIPEDLKEKIRTSAEEYNRSMGADIIARLEESFKLETHPHKIPMDVSASDDWIEKSGLTPEQMGEVMKQLAFERIEQIIDEKGDNNDEQL
jgi:hypothetical protein